MNPFLDEDILATNGRNPFIDGIVSPTVDEDEQDVISRVNNPRVESPRNFGFVEFPATIANEFNRSLLTIPKEIGVTVLEAGELAEGMKGKSTSDIAMESFATRLIKNIEEGDTGLKGLLQTIWGAEKDIILSALPDEVSPALVSGGKAMIEQNDAATNWLLGTAKQGFAADVGSGFGSLIKSIGAWHIGGTGAAGGYMTLAVNSSDYQEAREKGLDPEDAAAAAFTSAAIQGKIEKVGMGVFTAALATSSFFKKVLFRSAQQTVEETAQATVEETVKDVAGVRDTDFETKLHNILYQGALGFIVGAPTSVVFTKMEDTSRGYGIDPKEIKKQIEAFIKNKDQVIDGAAELLNREATGITKDEPARAEALKSMQGVLAEQEKIETAISEGSTQDPAIAAKVLMKTATPEVRAVIEALPKGFTMEQLQASLPKVDVALAETLALEEKQSVKMQNMLESFREKTAQLRQVTSLTKKQVQETQDLLTDFINNSELSLADKGKFLTTIKNTQTAKQLANNIDEIENRIKSLVEADQRRTVVGKIKRKAALAKDSGVIAVDFANQIQDLVNEIDLSKRKPDTLKAMQKTLDFMQKNPDADMPKDVLKKLQILNKKPIGEVTTQELESLVGEVDELIKQGKTKLKLMEAKRERTKQQRIDELQKATVKLDDTQTKRAPIGERLTAMENVKNRYAEFKNRLRRIGVATNPMDVFFDMLDGGKSYKGANHRIFKDTIDKAFTRYQNLKENATREVKNLHDKLELTEQNHERIGAYAVLQQEGGLKKLLDTGIPQTELDGLTLTDPEMQMYRLMRRKLDEMLPAIQEVMRVVYNKNVEGVKDYFPFMTDHEAMQDFEIQDMIGDNVPSIAKKKNVERGFTESRVGGKQKVRIDALGVFLKHVDNAAYLIEMGGDIKALGDVAASKEYGEAAGGIGQEMVVEWVDLLARKGNRPGRIHAIDTLRRNVGFAMLGYKLSTILIQPTALADGATLVGGGYVAQGVKDVATSKAWRKFLWDNFPEVRERAGDDPAYLDMGGKGVAGKVREAGFWALKNIDTLTASSVAAGAYAKAIEQKGGKVDFSNPDPDAIAEAQLMMRRTQASAFAKDAPAIITQGKLTGNVSIDRLILQFQTFMLNRWSLIKHDMWALGVRQGNTKQALNVATWIILANAAELGIRRFNKELIAALTGDDTDDWEETIGKEAFINALGNVPFVSQTVSAFEYGDVPVPAIGAITQITKRLRWAAQSDDEENKIKHLTSAIMISAGVIGGVPGTMQTEQIFRKALKDE